MNRTNVGRHAALWFAVVLLMLALAGCGSTEATPEPTQPVAVQSAGEAIAAVQGYLSLQTTLLSDATVLNCRSWLLFLGRTWSATLTEDGGAWDVRWIDVEKRNARLQAMLRARLSDAPTPTPLPPLSPPDHRWQLYPSGAVQTLDGVC